MLNKFKFYIYIAIGVIAIGLSIKTYAFFYEHLSAEEKRLYENITLSCEAQEDILNDHNPMLKKLTYIRKDNKRHNEKLTSLIQFGFGSILLISGLGFIAVGITSPLPKKDQEGDNE